MGPDGRHIGKVDDIIIDTSTMTVRCAEVKLDRDVAPDAEDRFLPVPIELVRIDPDPAHVVLVDFEITPAGAPLG